jgi:hypothetical protein
LLGTGDGNDERIASPTTSIQLVDENISRRSIGTTRWLAITSTNFLVR